ncbi:hypothetical protein CFP56_044049 [Quercus suber]|uniref:Uncharacterized protein n=1 Tax=Quercus suber TaxID=58331 RepID=A0AAW0LIF0_QUESU
MGGNVFENISPNVTSMYDSVIVSNKDKEYFYLSNRNQRQLKDLKGEDIARADNCDGYNNNGGCRLGSNQCWLEIFHPSIIQVIASVIVELFARTTIVVSPLLLCLITTLDANFGKWEFISNHSVDHYSIYVLSSKPSDRGKFTNFFEQFAMLFSNFKVIGFCIQLT